MFTAQRIMTACSVLQACLQEPPEWSGSVPTASTARKSWVQWAPALLRSTPDLGNRPVGGTVRSTVQPRSAR